ncbi:hypothetical protein [Leifsonia poae]|uniref:hypothetical protein n=1 Tax=Leifsonia poae TaxID=110933 RepID=UPI001CC00FD8|nr:hypothetical protein [Leifsonia poae]
MTPRTTVLRPHAHLFTRGIVAILALTTPVFAVLYWLTIPDGAWPLVLGIHILVVVATTLAVLAFFSTTIQLGPDGVRERGFFGRTVDIPARTAGAAVLIDLYEGSTLDTLPQLFVTGQNGRVLIRMRGQFWALEDMERVAEELDVPLTKRPESVTLNELRRTSPELLYWFERFPRFGR